MTIGYVAWGISCETYDICEGAGGHRNSRVFSLQNTYAEVATLAICFARSSGCPREARVSRTSAGRLAANARGVAFGRPKNATKSAGTGPGTCQRREIDQRRRQDLQRPSGDDLPRHRGIGALCYFSVPLSRTGLFQAGETIGRQGFPRPYPFGVICLPFGCLSPSVWLQIPTRLVAFTSPNKL